MAFGDVRVALTSRGEPDREAAETVIRALRPGCAIERADDSTLAEELYPADGMAYVAVLPNATIVCDRELATIELPPHVREFAAGRAR
ncbi:hypothetical protein BBK82_40685 [Lentzea guizhouensis]|uniref:Uncharacterized protein n=1 Tax=Lentzea guizhouensis TaxID=1586287 RepID=A0A1B2HUC8_9PSEU|nr:hypothetical protein BBK82_40685 [Lentzea guizhouensis]